MSNWDAALRGALAQWDAAERALAAAQEAKAEAALAVSQADAALARIKGDLLAMLQDAGVVGEPALGLSINKGRETVEALPSADPASLPPHLVRWEPKPDKAAILHALRDGQDVPGWIITQGAPHLTRRAVKTNTAGTTNAVE
jgi:hypothetical protein